MAENNFDSTVASLFKGMDAFISAKTVVGDAVTVKDTIILPLVDVSFGVGAGAFAGDKKNNAGGGMTGKVTPSAVLVIQNGATKLVNIKNQDTVTKVLDMIPDIIDKFKGGPVGLTTIATALGEDAGTIEEVYEPFLIKEGFLKRTPRGREVTELAYKHLGRSLYSSQKTLFDNE